MSRKLKMGMVGGGRGAFIGNVHRMAAGLDGQIELVCGAFSSDPDKSKLSGGDLFLEDHRVYGNYEEMMAREKALPDGERMDFVSIVTPNHMHFAPAMLALDNGFHVICDKPLCFDLEQAEMLKHKVEQTGLTFALTHNYTGYPMVKQARKMLSLGELGDIRRVVVSYSQGWLSTRLEATGQQQAEWRTDPERSGIAGAIGDIGTHAANLLEYVTGLRIKAICADISSVVEGRNLDDDGNMLIRMENGARGLLTVSQVAAGEENNLSINVYGTRGSLSWSQMRPNSLTAKWLDQPTQILRSGSDYLCPEAKAHTRLPAGHPEGYIEAFANIYRNFAICLRGRLENTEVEKLYHDFPGIDDGVRGMHFIYKSIEAANSKDKWIDI